MYYQKFAVLGLKKVMQEFYHQLYEPPNGKQSYLSLPSSLEEKPGIVEASIVRNMMDRHSEYSFSIIYFKGLYTYRCLSIGVYIYIYM